MSHPSRPGRGSPRRRLVSACRGATAVLLAAVTTQLGALPAEASTARAAAVAVNQAATSAVSLAAHPSGFDYAFYRGEDDGVYYRTFQNGVWSEQAGIGGRVVGAPGAALAGPGTLVVVGRGTDSALWTRTYSAGAWGPWQSLGGVLSAAPAVVGTGDGRIDVFVRTADNQLASRTRLPGGGWSGWVYLGGGLASGPAAVAFASGRVDVFVTGTNYGVWRRSLGGGAWSAWSTIGGRTYTAPAVTAVPGSFAPRVFVRGTTNALYLNQNTTGTWTGWQNLGGVLIDAPAAAATASGGLDVVVRGGDNALWARMLRGGAWSGFARAWAPAAPPPPAGSLLGTDWTRIPTSAKVVALTFDAGGNTAGLASIRATLQRRNVPATFYLTGAWVRSFPAQANEVAVAGFTTGNHSDTHPHFPALTDAQVRSQLLTAERTILQATGADPRPLFRFPFGDVNDRVLADVNALNYVAVRWTVDSLGWQGTSGGQTTQRVIDRVLAAAQPGEIVLMHVGSNPDDGTTLDAAALPAIIDGLRARGYSFVTLKALTG